MDTHDNVQCSACVIVIVTNLTMGDHISLLTTIRQHCSVRHHHHPTKQKQFVGKRISCHDLSDICRVLFSVHVGRQVNESSTRRRQHPKEPQRTSPIGKYAEIPKIGIDSERKIFMRACNLMRSKGTLSNCAILSNVTIRCAFNQP